MEVKDKEEKKLKEDSLQTWEQNFLGDLCEGNGRYGINASAVKFSHKLPSYIRITDIDDEGNFSPIKRKSVTEEGWKNFILEEGDILFVRTGSSTGKSYLYNPKDGELVYAGFLIRFRPIRTILLPEFLAQFTFTSFYNKWVSVMSVRSGQPGINSSEYYKLPILTPPISEQEKIVEILSTWDQSIDNTQKLINQLKLRKRGLMQELLTGKKRLPGLDGEWEENRLGNYFKERKDTGHDDLQLLSVGRNGVYPQDNLKKKDSSNSNKSKYKRICPGDIGYNTMRMWQGRSALSDLEGIVSPAYTILKPKENCDSVFFSYLFKLDVMVHKFYRNSQGMVSDTWMCKYKDLAIIKFMVPPELSEQKAIAKVLLTADMEIVKMKQNLESLNQQKKGLMQQLLTGKKRVKINE